MALWAPPLCMLVGCQLSAPLLFSSACHNYLYCFCTAQALGTPSDERWPGATSLPGYVEFQKVVPPPLRTQFPKVGCLWSRKGPVLPRSGGLSRIGGRRGHGHVQV